MTRCGTTRNHTRPDAARHARTTKQPRPPMVRRGRSAGDSSAVNCLPGLWTSEGAETNSSWCCLKATENRQNCLNQEGAWKPQQRTHMNGAKYQNRLTI